MLMGDASYSPSIELEAIDTTGTYDMQKANQLPFLTIDRFLSGCYTDRQKLGRVNRR